MTTVSYSHQYDYAHHEDGGRYPQLSFRVSSLENPALREEDIALMQAITSKCDVVRARWGELEAHCHEMPQTLVHNDFAGQNVRVRSGPESSTLVAFDWSSAGHGDPSPGSSSSATAKRGSEAGVCGRGEELARPASTSQFNSTSRASISSNSRLSATTMAVSPDHTAPGAIRE